MTPDQGPPASTSRRDSSPTLVDPERILAVLSELVRLKDIKDRDGESEDYRLNKDRAWEEARHVLAQNLQSP